MERPRTDTDLADALLAELGWVRKLARQLVGEAADDVTQEVATAALRLRPERSGLRAWLAAAVRKRAARWHRDGARRAAVEGDATPPGDSDAPAVLVDRLHRHRALVDAVLALPEPYRAVVVARYFDDLSPKAIAERRGVAAATVRQQVSRGLAMLRARLETTHGKDWRAGLGVLLTVGGTRAGTALGVLAMAKKSIGAALAVVILGVVVGSQWPRTAPPNLESDAAPGALRTAGTATVEATELDRDAVPIAEARSNAALDLRIVTASGQPVANADIVVGNEELAQRARADDHGRVSMPASDGHGHALVLAPSRSPHLFELDALSGEHTLTLPDGARVAGHVELLGDAAYVPFLPELELEPNGFDAATLPEAFGRHVDPDSLGSLRTRIGSDRTFSFDGLPAEWSGSIAVRSNSPFWLNLEPVEEPRRRVGIDRPRTELRLFLRPTSGVFGAVVWKDGTPVPRARLTIAVSKTSGTSSFGSRAGDDGRFGMTLTTSDSLLEEERVQQALRAVTVRADHPEAVVAQKRTITAAELAPGNHVGEVVLERAATAHVLVTDPAGAPVADALVESTRPQRTDALGRVTVRGSTDGVRTRRIGAPGARVDDYVATDGTGTQDDPLRFVVEPANTLEIRVTSAALPLSALRVEVESTAPLLTTQVEKQWSSMAFHRAAGLTDSRSAMHSSGPPQIWSFEFRVDENGLVRLVSVRPAVAIRVRVLDPLNTVAAEARTATPATADRETLALHVPQATTRLHGTARLAGQPIRGAYVTVGGDHISPHAHTGPDGKYDFVALASGRRAQLRASHQRAAAVLDEVVLLPGEQEVDFELAPGHPLTIRVRGPDDTAVDAEIELIDPQTGARIDEHVRDVHRSRIDYRDLRLTRLPAGTFRLRATIAGRAFERDIAVPSDEEVVVRIPQRPHLVAITVPDVPLDSVQLVLTDELGHESTCEILRKPDGRWNGRELWLFEGSYRVEVTHDGRAVGAGAWSIPAPDGRVTVPVTR